MKKVILSITLLSLALTCFTPAYGMKRVRTLFTMAQPLITKESLKNAYSKTWRGVVTATQWGLACLPIAFYGSAYFLPISKKYIQGIPNSDVPDKKQELIRRELEKCNIKNPEEVIIWKPENKSDNFYVTSETITNRFIAVNTKFCQQPPWWHFWKKDALNPKEKGILQHEAAHLKHKDTLKRSVVALSIGAITIGFNRIMRKVINPRTTMSWWRHLLGKPLHGLALGISNTALIHGYIRQQEQRADEAVENDPMVLKAMEKFLDEQAKKEEQFIALYKTKNTPLIQRATIALLQQLNEHFMTHPPAYKRAARFRQRWQALEKQQKEQEEKKQDAQK